MRKSILFLLPIFSFCFVNAQKGLLRWQAFSQPVTPGIERRDLSGEHIEPVRDTLHFVIMELTRGLKLQVDSASYKGSPAGIAFYEFGPAEKQLVTTTKGRKIKFQATKSTQLYRIELQAQPTKMKSSARNIYFLKGKLNGKTFRLNIGQEVRLQGEERG